MGPIWAALGPQSLVNNKVNNDKINVNPSLPFLMDGENSFQFAKKDLFDEAIHSNLSDRNTDYSILNNDAHSNLNNSQHRGDNTQSANPNSESNIMIAGCMLVKKKNKNYYLGLNVKES